MPSLPSINFLYQHLCKISFTDGFKLYDKFIFVKPSVRLTFKVNCPLRTSVNPVLLRQPHSCLNVLFGQPHSCSSLSSQGLTLWPDLTLFSSTESRPPWRELNPCPTELKMMTLPMCHEIWLRKHCQLELFTIHMLM